jgi:hypothetical protein
MCCPPNDGLSSRKFSTRGWISYNTRATQALHGWLRCYFAKIEFTEEIMAVIKKPEGKFTKLMMVSDQKIANKYIDNINT